ncbi:MAG: arginase family protein [Acidobacteriota bacterium]
MTRWSDWTSEEIDGTDHGEPFLPHGTGSMRARVDGSGTGDASSLPPGAVALLGIAFDENSSFSRGPAAAPAAVRAVLHSPAGNGCSESGIDLLDDGRFVDVGDLARPQPARQAARVAVPEDPGATGPGVADPDPGEVAAFFEQVRATVGNLLEQGARVLTLGGDHSISYPILQAYARIRGPVEVVHVDAHPDLYDRLDGNRFSHGAPFARIMEDHLASRLVQVGIRAGTEEQSRRASRFGVETIPMARWRPGVSLGLTGPVYLSVDIDGLDPAHAPGVSHPEPGGLSTRDLLGLIQGLRVPLIGADIVEINPRRDPAGLTAAVGAKLVKEIAAAMLAG